MMTPRDKGAALVIDTDGDVREVQLADDGHNLKRFHEALGCTTVDVVRMTTAIDMWIDDEGLITGREINMPASALAASFGWSHQFYVGPVLLAAVDEDGESINLASYQVKAVKIRLRDLVRR